MEVIAFLEEDSAVVGKETMEQIYKLATSQHHQFLFVRLTATDVNDMFYNGVQQRIRITGGQDGDA